MRYTVRVSAPGLARLAQVAKSPRSTLAPAHTRIAEYLVDTVTRHITAGAGIEGPFDPLAPFTIALRGDLPPTPLVESGAYRDSWEGQPTDTGAVAGTAAHQAPDLELGASFAAARIPVDVYHTRTRISGRPRARSLRIGPVTVPGRPHIGISDEEVWDSVDRLYFPALMPGDANR